MRLFLHLLIALCALAAARAQEAAPEFQAFLSAVWPQAEQAGVSRATFAAAVAGLTPDPAILKRPSKQGEFSLKISDYIAQSVTAGRIAQGRKKAAAEAQVLRVVERRTGAPASIILALWAVETNFGANQGSTDVLSALAAHALRADRGEMFRDEFVAALVMIEKAHVRRDQLRGSWAGAMGQPQFMPSSYLTFARSFAGDAAADIWNTPSDVIASIGNFLKESGWVAGAPAVVEVVVPASFDWKPLDLDFAGWRALGFRRADGGALPASGLASLYLPEGAQGPAFLLSENWEVLRRYNTSDAYALSVALIAAGIEGGRLTKPFPKTVALSLADRVAAQKALMAHGFYRGATDGKIGRKTRVAAHDFQIARGIAPADGFLTPDLLRALKGQ